MELAKSSILLWSDCPGVIALELPPRLRSRDRAPQSMPLTTGTAHHLFVHHRLITARASPPAPPVHQAISGRNSCHRSMVPTLVAIQITWIVNWI
jgi:hypothetical protein